MTKLKKIWKLLTVTRVILLSRGALYGWRMGKHAGFLSLGKFSNFKSINTIRVGRYVTISSDVTIGSNVSAGSWVGIGKGTYIDDNVQIGDRVSISRYVSIMTSTHDHLSGKRRAGPMYSLGSTEIGDGSWIGTHAIILPQVRKIGAYSIVAAGAVVTKDVEENCVVAGNPARVIKRLEPLSAE